MPNKFSVGQIYHAAVSLRGTTTAALALLFWFGPLCIDARAAIEGNLDLFGEASRIYKENFDKLRTWKGTASYLRRTSESDGSKMELDADISFASDAASTNSWFSIVMTRYVRLRDGVESPHTSLMTHRGLHRDETYYDLSYTNSLRVNRGGFARSKPLAKPDWGFNSFDPAYFMTKNGAQWDQYWERLRQDSDRIQGSISLQGSEVTFLQSFPGDSVVSVQTIDLAKGANVTRSLIIDNLRQNESLETFAFKEVAGVWVPSEAISRMTVKRPDAKSPIVTLTIKWIENQVNVPFSKDEFALPQLGLQQGDSIYDSRTKRTSIVKGEEFPLPPSK